MPYSTLLNLHAVIKSSGVNGPGRRLVVFFQGCRRRCEGCFNPETHPFEPRLLMTADELFRDFFVSGIEGITVSGGEPFLQCKGLLELLISSRLEHGLSTVVYTGFTYEEILDSPEMSLRLGYIDALVDGQYDPRMPEDTLLARGSTNQRFILLTGRYTAEDFYLPAKAELVISSDGTVAASGFASVVLRQASI
ncbi:MAG: radical SAM protein [Deltaproteobacteria bacterium]|nr:radical SAM protein [Deltaproteobacteria bacterium]